MYGFQFHGGYWVPLTEACEIWRGTISKLHLQIQKGLHTKWPFCVTISTTCRFSPHTSCCNYVRAILLFYQTAKTKYLQSFTCLHNRSSTAQTDMSDVIIRRKLRCTRRFIHSISMFRMRRFLAVLRSFFHSSLLYTLSFHPFPPTSLPSSLTSSCHLFLGLHLNLAVPKFKFGNSIFFHSLYMPKPTQSI